MNNFNYVVAIRSVPMAATTKLVAVTLATYADYQTGECYPTIQTLMEDTGLSNRVVCQHLKLIETMGILIVDRSNGRRSYYRFIAENITKAMTQRQQLRRVTSDFHSTKPVTLVQEAVTLVQEAVTQSHTNNHKQPIEQLKEQPDIYSCDRTDEKPAEPKAKKSKPTMTTLPTDFRVSQRVQSWASEKGFDRLDEHLENFIGFATANAKKYADWDAALMNAIRGNWAKLKPIQQPQYRSTGYGYQSSAQRIASEHDRWRQAESEVLGHSEWDVTPKKSLLVSEVGYA